MKRHAGGTRVEGGYYWHVGTWEIAPIRGETGTLPGGPQDQYLHAPVPVLFLAAPVMGAAFAMFLPFIGVAMPVYGIARGLFKRGREARVAEPAVDTQHLRA